MKMLEIFERVIKKRLLHKAPSTSMYIIWAHVMQRVLLCDAVDFQLERKDTPGELVDLGQSLETLGTDEFLLIRVNAS